MKRQAACHGKDDRNIGDEAAHHARIRKLSGHEDHGKEKGQDRTDAVKKQKDQPLLAARQGNTEIKNRVTQNDQPYHGSDPCALPSRMSALKDRLAGRT